MFNTNTFENRYNLGDLLSNSINELFDSNEIELIPFGFENLFYDKTNLKSFIDSINCLPIFSSIFSLDSLDR